MDIDFAGIRRRLRNRWSLFRWQVMDAQEQASRRTLRRMADLLGKDTTELEASERSFEEKIASQHQVALFTSVGHALSAWAQMEESLVAIAGLLLSTRFTKAGVVMYSIINFSVWLAVIDELFSLEAEYAAVKPKWNKINERLRKLKDVRDRLAHHTIHTGPRGTTFADAPGLNPARLDTRRKSQKYQPLNFDQVNEFSHSVAKVTLDLAALIDAMTEIYERTPSPQKSSPPDPDQNPPSDAQ
jgi:hypothetical protein